MLEKLPDILGHALHDVRAGLDSIVFNTLGLRAGMASIQVESPAFADHAPIPPRFTADAEGVSPPLRWQGMPSNAASALLLVEDADSPTPQPIVHAIVVDLPMERPVRAPTQATIATGGGQLAEGALSQDASELPAADDAGDVARQATDLALHIGRNSYLQTRWLPPDPPPGHGVHRYAFQVYALGIGAEFSESPGREEVVGVLRDHALASGLLIGTYERDSSLKVDAQEPATAFAVAPLAPG